MPDTEPDTERIEEKAIGKIQEESNMKNKNMKNNRYKRIIYGTLASVIVIGSIGGVAANETRQPYKAPELQLTQGQTDYDLTEGIGYVRTKRAYNAMFYSKLLTIVMKYI